MKKIMGICDKDEEYVKGLSAYIMEKSPLEIEVYSFTNTEALKEFTRGKKMDILLISDLMEAENIAEVQLKRRLYMTEEKTEKKNSVYKYQRVDGILREVMTLYEAEVHALSHEERWRGRKRVMGIYSPLGGVRKTSFALCLGEILSENRNVLYINTESLSGLNALLGREFDLGLSDLLYFAKQKCENLAVKLQLMTVSLGSLYILPPAAMSEDLRGISGIFFINMLSRLLQESTMEILILDLSDVMGDIVSVMKFCDRVFVPIRKDSLAKGKLREFDKMTEGSISKEKIKKIELPFAKTEGEGEELIQSLVYSSFGDRVRQLVREEMLYEIQ